MATNNDSQVKEWLDKGADYFGQGNHAEAKRCWEKAIAIDPDNASAYHFNMGNVYIELGNLAEAIRCWEKAAALGREHVQKKQQQ